MKKNIFILIALVSFSLLSYAGPRRTYRTHRFASIASSRAADKRISLGLRGGVAIPYGPKDQMKGLVGFDGLFDAQYAMYWPQRDVRIGFITGITLGYQTSGLSQETLSSEYITKTDCGPIKYSIQASGIKENKKRLDLELPIMFGLVTDKGLFFNVGPKFAFPVWTNSMVECSSIDINAYFQEEGVDVPNEWITGISDGARDKAEWNKPIMSLKLGMEIGYEFKFDYGDGLSVGAYMDWSGLSIYKSQKETGVVKIVPPSDEGPAEVSYRSPSDEFRNKLGFANVGLKATYHFKLK